MFVLKENKAEKISGNKAQLKTHTTQKMIVMDRKKSKPQGLNKKSVG